MCWYIYPDNSKICLKKRGWNTDPNTWDGKIHVNLDKKSWGTNPNIRYIVFKKRRYFFNY
jgi:hypothetical protein